MLFLDNPAPDSCCAERPLHLPTYPYLVFTAATVRGKTCGETKSQTNRLTDRPTDPTDYNNPSLRMRARGLMIFLITISDHNNQDTENDDTGNEILTLKVFPELLHSEFGVYERW